MHVIMNKTAICVFDVNYIVLLLLCVFIIMFCFILFVLHLSRTTENYIRLYRHTQFEFVLFVTIVQI